MTLRCGLKPAHEHARRLIDLAGRRNRAIGDVHKVS